MADVQPFLSDRSVRWLSWNVRRQGAATWCRWLAAGAYLPGLAACRIANSQVLVGDAGASSPPPPPPPSVRSWQCWLREESKDNKNHISLGPVFSPKAQELGAFRLTWFLPNTHVLGLMFSWHHVSYTGTSYKSPGSCLWITKEQGDRWEGNGHTHGGPEPGTQQGERRDQAPPCHLPPVCSRHLAFSELLLHLPCPLFTNISGALQQGNELNTELSFQNCSKG